MVKDNIRKLEITIDTSKIDDIHLDDLGMEIRALLSMSFDIDENDIKVETLK